MFSYDDIIILIFHCSCPRHGLVLYNHATDTVHCSLLTITHSNTCYTHVITTIGTHTINRTLLVVLISNYTLPNKMY